VLASVWIAADIAVHNVPVALLDSSGHLLRVTLTALDGTYHFHDMPTPLTSLRLMMLQDGILRPVLRSSGNWLRVNQYDILGENDVVGVAHNVSSPIFNMLIDEEQQPVYNRALSYNSFQGDAKPLAWWRFMMSNLGELEDNLSQTDFNTWNSAAVSLLSCSASISSSSPLEANLKAAALNEVSGRGIFEPYRMLQGWMIQYAEHIFCAGISNASDQSVAMLFMQDINTSSDINSVV